MLCIQYADAIYIQYAGAIRQVRACGETGTGMKHGRFTSGAQVSCFTASGGTGAVVCCAIPDEDVATGYMGTVMAVKG